MSSLIKKGFVEKKGLKFILTEEGRALTLDITSDNGPGCKNSSAAPNKKSSPVRSKKMSSSTSDIKRLVKSF